MAAPELAQLKMLAQVDDLVAQLKQWGEAESHWKPINESRALVRRLLTRVHTLRIRLESPLVVATFGGTGTGKSSLVNALIGRECTRSGRQRPTTRSPILIAHPETELDALGLPLDEFEVNIVDAPVLRDIVIVDCPDPDTSEGAEAGSNLSILRNLVPHCDVLIYTSTQQKYRSARVVDELAEAASGCRLIFVQTHADVDQDIREDWRNNLEGNYQVPEMFFVDSVRALKQQQAGERPGGDFARLQDMLTTQLAASQRVQVRRANLVDLIQAALEQCRDDVNEKYPNIQQLRTALEEQRSKLTGTLSGQLRDELLVNRNLWERRLLSSVTDTWGFSPFSAVLRFYNGIGNFIASFTLFRARSSAQMALIGAVQGARWIKNRTQEQDADSKLDRLSSFGLNDSKLHESQIVIDGFVREAELDESLANISSLETMRDQAARVEDQFLGDARRRIDEIIDALAVKHSGLFTKVWYEVLLMFYLGFLLFRIGKNFFWDSFVRPMVEDVPKDVELLTIDFYVPAAIFFALWSGVLVMFFTRRLRRGLNSQIQTLAQDMAETRVSQGLFPQLETACQQLERDRQRLEFLAENTTQFRRDISHVAPLGGQVRGS